MSAAIAAARIEAAASIVRAGGVIAYPTEAVFGLGCSPFDLEALQRTIALKRRRVGKGLIVIGARPEHLTGLIGDLAYELPPSEGRATTWITPALPGVSSVLTGGGNAIAVRLTGHPLASGLCDAIGGALVSTSANRAGARPLVDARAVRYLFGRDIDYVLSGPCGFESRPSRIVEWKSRRVVRE